MSDTRDWKIPRGPYVDIDRRGWDWCEHTWRDVSYNDWGFAYYVAECSHCGRKVSSPMVDVFRELTEIISPR